MKKNLMTLAIAILSFYSAIAQMITPQTSPYASVTQRVGITDISITYHRPAVNEREIWNTNVVPFDGNPFPWRAGANDNTLFITTHDLSFGEHILPAGEYGLHIIPRKESSWIVVFSNNTTSWGSFRYNKEEDALRVEVTPTSIAHQENLLYHFTSLSNNGTTLNLDWEKKRIAIPFKISKMDEVVLAYYDKMLQGRLGFNWRNWFEKALYCEQNDTHLEEGLAAIDMSIMNTAKFDNYNLKESILRKLGKEEEANKIAHEKIHEIASGGELNGYGYTLLWDKKYDEALEIFQLNIKKHPNEANFYDSLAECYKDMGEDKKAIENYKKALSMNPPPFVKDNAIKMLKELGVDYSG